MSLSVSAYQNFCHRTLYCPCTISVRALLLDIFTLNISDVANYDIIFLKLFLVLSKVPGAGVLSCISKYQSIN